MAKKKLGKQELRMKKLTALVRLLFATKDDVEQAASVFYGFLNPQDGKFYAKRTAIVDGEQVTGYNYTDEIAGKTDALYVELESSRIYAFDGMYFWEVVRSYGVVTPSTSGQGGSAGLMIPTDKEKLDAIAYAGNSDIDEIFA